MAALRAHSHVSDVQDNGCGAVRNICFGQMAAVARKQRAVDAGAIEAAVAALRNHPQDVGVQDNGCGMLGNLCHGADAAGLSRKRRVMEAGTIEAAVAALLAYPQVDRVQEAGCAALRNVCAGGPQFSQRAAAAGAKVLVERAVASFPQSAILRNHGPILIAWL